MTEQTDISFEGLIKMARDRTVEGRTRLVQAVGDLFFDTSRVLTDRERALMGEILRRLIHDVEMSVRRALADRLARENAAPHDLIKLLANDAIEVSHPILLHSDVLQDVDLIEVVQHRTLEHQLAIAMWDSVSETITDALVETGNQDVIKSLMENANAEISKRTMEYLVEESRRIDGYRNPLVHRSDLGPELAKRMYWWVSAALRGYILDHFKIEASELEERLEDVVDDLVSSGERNETPVRKATELARRLKQEKQLSPRLLVQTLRQGEVTLFEDLFAQMTGLRTTLIRRFIFEPGGEGLAIACKGVGVEKTDFTSIFLLSRSARPGDKVVDPNELSKVLGFFDQVKRETAEKVLRRWRLDPDFLFALKRVHGRDQEAKDG